MTTTSGTDHDRTARRYLDQLAHDLHLRGVPGARIGEILAEAEAHAAATGETLQEAFGDPRDYAEQWAGRSRRLRRSAIPYTAATAVGGFGMGLGVTAIAGDGTALGLPALVVALLGAVVLVGTMLVVPVNRIRDPRTGALRGPSRLLLVAPMAAAALLLLVVAYAVGQ